MQELGAPAAMAHIMGPPLHSVSAAGTITPSIISGLSAGTRTAATNNTRQLIKIRPSNVHPQIKLLMEPHIQHCKGVVLEPMMEHRNTTIDDYQNHLANAHCVITTFLVDVFMPGGATERGM